MHRVRRKNAFKKNVIDSEIIRNVHSLEKGMSLPQPRMEFGKTKISNLFNLLAIYEKQHWDCAESAEPKMAISVLVSYLSFHKERNYESEYLDYLNRRVNDYVSKNNFTLDNFVFGGTRVLNSISFSKSDIMIFEKIIKSRHSIRDFSDEPVDESVLLKAIELANCCPSACNRQTTRVYLIDKNRIKSLEKWLSGIGGFAETVPYWLIITGVTSAFNDGEVFQHIVNAGISVGYLVSALTAYGLSSCVVQRPLVYSRTWNNFSKDHNISRDEQVVCFVAVGKSKEQTRVPISYRFDSNHFFRKI